MVGCRGDLRDADTMIKNIALITKAIFLSVFVLKNLNLLGLLLLDLAKADC